ncbi:MAG: MaoC family dehydratase [Pseudomonadota bacterium]
MQTVFRTPDDFMNRVGQQLGASDWITLEQRRVDLFAEATGDHQWIHVDPVRAAEGPFGACIAHGYLSLSLVNLFLPQVVTVENMTMGVNYGCERVRFPAPLRVGKRVRGVCELVRAEAMPGNGVQATVRVSLEIDGEPKPACVADTISRYFFS